MEWFWLYIGASMGVSALWLYVREILIPRTWKSGWRHGMEYSEGSLYIDTNYYPEIVEREWKNFDEGRKK